MNNSYKNVPVAAILATCLDEIRAGQMTKEECLLLYPVYRDELSDLLETAKTIETIPLVSPRPAFRQSAKVDLLNKLRPLKNQNFLERIRYTLKISMLTGQPKNTYTWATAILIIVLFIFTGTGVTYASASALPGELLYGVKTTVENVRLIFSGDENDVRLFTEYSQTRLEEIEQLLDRGNNVAVHLAVLRYKQDVNGLVQTMARLTLVPGDRYAFYLAERDRLYLENMQTLDGILKKAPEETKPIILQAILVTGEMKIDQPSDSNPPDITDLTSGLGEPDDQDETPGSKNPEDQGAPADGAGLGEISDNYLNSNSSSGGNAQQTVQPAVTQQPENKDNSENGNQPDSAGQPEEPNGNPNKRGPGH